MNKINIPEVIWQEIGKDDYQFKFINYNLRIEKLNKHCWWWDVYYKNESNFVDAYCKTKKEAMLSAELAFIKHLITN